MDLTRGIGQDLHRQAPPQWLWNGRPVSLVDGSTATALDSEENQAEYPQSRNQKPGLGFPILRFVVVISLSHANHHGRHYAAGCGSVLGR